MFRLIFLLLIVFACIWGYQNFDSIKAKTIDAVQHEKSIEIYNSSINKTQKEIDEALKF